MRLNLSTLSKIALFATLLLCGGTAFAQNFDRLTFRIDSFANVGLPKSALAEVKKLDDLARRQKNVSMQIRAVVYRMTFQSYLEESALTPIIDSLKADIKLAAYPVKPVLRSVLANMYYQYYQQNRWQFNQRSRVLNPGTDHTKWDLRTIIDETSRLYQLSLDDPARLQATSLDVFDDALTGDKSLRYLRPTLYDLLVHRALEFYLADEPALTKPKDPFSLNDPAFFNNADAFTKLKINTTDTTSTWYHGVKLLQQASRFHLKEGNKEALADMDLQRFDFFNRQATLNNKDSLYLNGLKRLAVDVADKPISADALVAIGSYYKIKDSLITAMYYLKQAAAKFPNSKGHRNALMLIKDITTASISAQIERENIPGKHILFNLKYKNVSEAKYAIYRLTDKEIADHNKPLISYNGESEAKRLAVVIKGRTPIQQQVFSLKADTDYRQHNTEYRLQPLSVGTYVLTINHAGATDSLMQLTAFSVTGLAAAIRLNPNHDLEVRVVDRDKGTPLKGVNVKMIDDDTRNPRQFAGTTNDKGIFMVVGAGRGGYKATLRYENDVYHYSEHGLYAATYDKEEDDEPDDDKTVLFTDRQIYRPGQTIYFKGLQLEIFKDRTKIAPGKEIDVDIEDANNKKITSLSFKTNEYGTFAGQFIIPQNTLSGRLTLSADDGEIEVQVEEYKRPTFKAELLPVTRTYKPNDSVTVRGTVTAFSGYGLSNVKVAYRVTRTVRYNVFDNYSRWPGNTTEAEIKTDTIISDSKGVFDVKFKAVPAEVQNMEATVFNYKIAVSVTEAAGETRTAESNVSIGYKTLQLTTTIPNMLLAKNADKALVYLKNLNGRPQNGKIRMRIYVLKQPKRTFKNRVWYQQPDRFLMSDEEYERYFPGIAAYKHDDRATWQEVRQITEANIKVDTINTAFVDLKELAKQPPGVYKVLLNGQNDRGDTTSTTGYISTLAEKFTPQSFTDWVLPVATKLKPGQDAEFLVGIDKPCQVLVEKYNGPKLLKSEWLKLDTGMRTIKIPVAANEKQVAVQFMMIHENRMYTSFNHISSLQEEGDIDIKLLSYKNKLQPGEKDQWKLQLSAGKNEKLAAEMVAGMYDASLDDVAPPQTWSVETGQADRYSHRVYYSWNGPYGFLTAENTLALFYHYNSYSLFSNQYEHLNLFGYNYYGGYNYGYRNYMEIARQRVNKAAHDKVLEQSYRDAAAKVKNGYEISGKVLDGQSQESVVGAAIKIKGTSIGVVTNSDGYFRLRVPKGATIAISMIGYHTAEYKTNKTEHVAITLQTSDASLEEVVVVGYAVQKKMELTGAVSVVNNEVLLQGKVAGVSAKVNGKEFSGVRGVASLPADLIEKVQVVDDRGDQASKPIALRKNFAETAFFYPQLHTDSRGQILIGFTMPESLTKWRFKAFAHTKDLRTGYREQEIITQKTLSITANTPRFLREGDTLTVSARLANLSGDQQKGKIELQLFNALNMQPVKLLLDQAYARQDFDIAAATTKAVSFKMMIPAGLDAVTYRLTADAGKFSDGEENTLPVLPNRMLVAESMPMMVRAGQQKTFTFDKLINPNSSTLKSKTLTLEYTQNPAWYAVQALPYMMEFPYECSEQLFSRFYANSLGTDLVNKMPVIRSVFERWKASNSTQLLSNLEKNPELKSVLLEETPWLREAADETDQKKRISLLFDVNKMSYELDQVLEKLSKRQLPGGGFPWFAGDHDDRYITQHIIAGMGQLAELGIAYDKKGDMKSMAAKAIAYLDRKLLDDERWRKQHANGSNKTYLSQMEVHAWYAKSYFSKAATSDMKALLNTYLKLAAEQWLSRSIYEQGMIALTMHRNGKADVAAAIIKSLKERAQQSEDLGMYWADNRTGWYWYQAPIETQSLMIELFTLVPGNQKEVEELKVWLLRNKQTSNWKSTKATAAAVYALLLKGDDVLAEKGTTSLRLNGIDLATLKPDTKAEAGSGYIKTSWADEQVKPELGKVQVANNSKIVSWGALHWQYLENLDKITSSSTDIKLERKYFIEKQGDAGKVLQAVDATHIPKVGDILKVVVYLKTTRDMEYIHLKDMRPAGTEPVDVLSAFKFQDGLYYYQVTKDVATNFFISSMKKGNYVFEYSLRVAQPGNYSTGTSTVQNMYAPEFNAHSEGGRLLVR